jgi:hypothetical protein
MHDMSPFGDEPFCSDEVGLDRFFNRENVALYRALADKGTDTLTRRRILERLQEEEMKLKLEFRRLPD